MGVGGGGRERVKARPSHAPTEDRGCQNNKNIKALSPRDCVT